MRVADFEFVSLAVRARRHKQDKKWGPSEERPVPTVAVLGEEFGEVCEAILEGDTDAIRYELLDLTAVGHAMLEAIERGDVPSG